MKWILLSSLLLISSYTFAQSSHVIPAFLEAAESYSNGQKDLPTLRPATRAVLEAFKRH